MGLHGGRKTCQKTCQKTGQKTGQKTCQFLGQKTLKRPFCLAKNGPKNLPKNGPKNLPKNGPTRKRRACLAQTHFRRLRPKHNYMDFAKIIEIGALRKHENTASIDRVKYFSRLAARLHSWPKNLPKNGPTRKRRACLAQTHFRGKNIANANDFWSKKGLKAIARLAKTKKKNLPKNGPKNPPEVASVYI
jgi:hypothetical protein